MEKIIFTLNNKDIHHQYSATSFTTFELALSIEKSSVHQFMTTLGAFDANDFHRLNSRIADPSNVRVDMNEKHVIIYYSVIHFAASVFVNPVELAIMMKNLEKEETISLLRDASVREKILEFGMVVSQKFRKDFSRNKRFMKVASKLYLD
jgi:hypothetical protein